MDDIVVLAPSRWKLRRAVRVVNQTLNGLGLEKRREKTFIGRIEKGFDFLGYHLGPGRLAVAQKTVERFVERARRLYEQGPGGGLASARLGRYVQRWFRWARAEFLEGLVVVERPQVSCKDETCGGDGSPLMGVLPGTIRPSAPTEM